METFKNQPRKKAVTFSFDDGVVQDIRMVELLNKYGLKCTFNLNSQRLGQARMIVRENLRTCHYKVAPQDVKEIYAGHEVAVHTLTHPNLTRLEKDEIIRQVEEDRKNLEALVAYPVVGMAYPCGGVNNDERVASIIRKHTKIRYCRTIDLTDSFVPQENLYRLRANATATQWDRLWALGRQFLESKSDEPQIFYIWGHAYEMDYDSANWARLEDFFRFISGQPDIYYGTNAQVLL